MPIRRPPASRVAHLGKPKRVATAPSADKLAYAAANAFYRPSEYHCPGVGGRRLKFRPKPSSICPRGWGDDEATDAIREAIRRGNVSENWEDSFPRYVWHRDGEVLYEARHTRGPSGSFHAFPIEEIQAPRGLRL